MKTKILITQIRWTTTTSIPWSAAWMQSLIDKTHAFLLENSYGKMDVEWTVSPFITIAPTYFPNGYQCGPQLAALGIYPQDFSRAVYMSPGLAGYGKGYASGNMVWMLGGIDYAHFALPHELGHTWGCGHAEFMQMGETEYVGLTKTLRFPPLAYTTGGKIDGTGDPCSVMGYSGTLTHFAMDEKQRMGWITPVVWDGVDRTYKLTAASVQGGALYAVRVPMTMFPTGPGIPLSRREYLIEYRVRSGWDSKVKADNEGIQIRVSGDFGCYTPTAIDATMRAATYGSPNNPRSDIAFRTGDSFTDDTIILEVLSCSPTEAEFRIRPVPPLPIYAPGTQFIIDNLPAGASGISGDGEVSFTGIWKTQGVQQMRAYKPNSALAAYKSTVPATYTFKTKPLPAGRYDVSIWYPSQILSSAYACVAVPFTVSGHTSDPVTKIFDQRFYGGQWILHGTYDFAEGAQGIVSVTNGTDVAIADAVRFLKAV